MTSLMSTFNGLAHERISGYLHIKKQKALQKASGVIERNVALARN